MIQDGSIFTCDRACDVLGLLDSMLWQHPNPPPVRQTGGDAFINLSDAQRNPKRWAMPTQPNLDELKAMVLAMEQILGHFAGGKLDGKRWQLRHTHALWEVFFPGTPPPQKLSDLQMYELDTDMPSGEIAAVILTAKCALLGDDLLNTSGNAQPAAAATLGALAEAVGVEIGVGAVDKAAASRQTLLIVTNLRHSQCVQKPDGGTARSKGPFLAAAYGHPSSRGLPASDPLAKGHPLDREESLPTSLRLVTIL